MNIKDKLQNPLVSGIVGASIALVMSGVGMYVLYSNGVDKEVKLNAQYQKELSVLNETSKLNEEGYSIVEDVDRGTLITEEMLQKVVLPKGAKPEDSVSVQDINASDYYARADLKKSTVLLDSSVYTDGMIENDVREGEFSFVELPTKSKTGDMVDIRIQFPNGNDYVLLPKKKIKEREGITMWLNVDEGEQQLLSSAVVDAYVEEARIYAVNYVDGDMQDAPKITYPVKSNVLNIIKETPNIVDIAKLNLAQQNRERLDNALQQVTSEIKSKLREGYNKNSENQKRDDSERKLNELNEEQVSQEDLIGVPVEE